MDFDRDILVALEDVELLSIMVTWGGKAAPIVMVRMETSCIKACVQV